MDEVRRFKTLPRESRERLSDYVRMHALLSSKELAEDLALPVTTIAAIKANRTREMRPYFMKG
jgi:hypothetical protein